MYRQIICLFLLVVAIAVLAVVFGCSDPTGDPDPTFVSVVMKGQLEVDSLPGVAPEDLTVYFGANEASPDTAGNCDLRGTSGTPGLVIAVDGDASQPILFSLAPNPTQGHTLRVDLHTTAVALVFMSPYVITKDAADAGMTISQIESLPEFVDFEEHLTERMTIDPDRLLQRDVDTDSLFTRAVAAYIMEFIPDDPKTREIFGTADAPIVIDPSYERGGLKVTHKGGDTFQVRNSLGRWCYAVHPDGANFFVSPIGDLIDILKGSAPFSPSQTDFNLSVQLGEEPKEVGFYGYGWAPDLDNSWDALGENKQHYARLGGMMTMTVEFVPAAISVILNVRSQFRGSQQNPDDIIDFMGAFTSSQSFLVKLDERVEAGDVLGVGWLVFKQFISHLATDEDFQLKTAEFMGFAFSEAVFQNLVAFAAPPIKLINSTDAAVTVGKTLLGFRNGRYATEFDIWQEAVDPDDFGNILGTVHAADSGSPLAGVTVILEGDDENPLNPSHDDITNADGAYFFENITVGAKTVRASKEGYNGASVTVTVAGATTVTAPEIELSPEVGNVSGRVLDEILDRHNVADGLFQKQLSLFINEIGGENREYYRTTSNGQYNLGLPAGRYWVVATHPDYSRDSLQVDVPADGNVIASRDLLLYARGAMTGTVKFDMDNNGSWESEQAFTSPYTSCSDIIDNDYCSTSQLRPYLQALGFNGLQHVMFRIDTTMVTGPDLHDLGPFDDLGCSPTAKPMSIMMVDTAHLCSGSSSPIYFLTFSDPDAEGCNCGITSQGTVVFDEFGAGLTDVVSGAIYSGTLAGWNDCDCHGSDTDNDGEIDTWDVDCARARLALEFRFLVGSMPNKERSQVESLVSGTK